MQKSSASKNKIKDSILKIFDILISHWWPFLKQTDSSTHLSFLFKMSNSGSSTPESDDTFISVQENFELNPVLDINTQESEKSEQNNSTKILANEDTALDVDLQLDKEELERIFSEPFEEVTVSTETNEMLAQLAKEKEKEMLPGDVRKLCEGTHFKAICMNEIEKAKMATIAEKL